MLIITLLCVYLCVCVCVCLQPVLTSAQEEWGMGRHRHMHDINSLRCQRQPMYGRDLVHTILSLCRQPDRRPSQPSSSSPATTNEGVWLWTGSLACERVMTGVRPEDGGSGSLALSKALLSYHTRAHMMGDTIRRLTNSSHFSISSSFLSSSNYCSMV